MFVEKIRCSLNILGSKRSKNVLKISKRQKKVKNDLVENVFKKSQNILNRLKNVMGKVKIIVG